MPRTPRIELAGAVHHVTAKTPSGRVLFVDDLDRRRYLQLLAREINDREWSLLSYCQLTNHVHILVRTPEPDLGAGFKRIHETFAGRLNRHHRLEGHVFGARFYNKLVRDDSHLQGCLRYIARNPVEAGMCSHPREWPWSAHRALAGLTDPPEFLDVDAAYGYLSRNEGRARASYLQLAAKSNAAILADLARPDSDAWFLTAIDDFAIPVADVATFLEIGKSTMYRRLAAVRETEGSVPPVSGETEGSVP